MENGHANGGGRPPINIALRAATEDQQEWSFTTFIDRDAEAGEINTVLDKLRTVADRQRWIVELKGVERGIEADLSKLDVTERAIDTKDEADRAAWSRRNKRGEFERTGTELANWDRMMLAVEDLKMRIKVGRQRVKELSDKIGA